MFCVAAYTSTFAGNGTVGYADGVGTNSMVFGPLAVAVDTLGNMYVGDAGNALRYITSSGNFFQTEKSNTDSFSAKDW